MAALRLRLRAPMALFVGIFCVSICLFSSPSVAQSLASQSEGTNVSYVALYSPVTASEINGIVLDRDGNPVPGAEVTLWQDGRVWMEGKRLSGCTNPQLTYPFAESYGHLRNDGEFAFVFVNRGSFVVTAEKNGYKGSAIVYVTEDPSNASFNGSVSPPVKITLQGYRVPVFSPEQLSYTGAIAGTLRGYYNLRTSVNVSLWRDGDMVRMPGNPQMSKSRNFYGREVDYLFEHLPQGRYQVVAAYTFGGNFTDNVTVDVGGDVAMADILLSHVIKYPPTIFPMTTPVPSSTPGAASFPGFPVIIMTIVAAILSFNRLKNGQ